MLKSPFKSVYVVLAVLGAHAGRARPKGPVFRNPRAFAKKTVSRRLPGAGKPIRGPAWSKFAAAQTGGRGRRV